MLVLHLILSRKFQRLQEAREMGTADERRVCEDNLERLEINQSLLCAIATQVRQHLPGRPPRRGGRRNDKGVTDEEVQQAVSDIIDRLGPQAVSSIPPPPTAHAKFWASAEHEILNAHCQELLTSIRNLATLDSGRAVRLFLRAHILEGFMNDDLVATPEEEEEEEEEEGDEEEEEELGWLFHEDEDESGESEEESEESEEEEEGSEADVYYDFPPPPAPPPAPPLPPSPQQPPHRDPPLIFGPAPAPLQPQPPPQVRWSKAKVKAALKEASGDPNILALKEEVQSSIDAVFEKVGPHFRLNRGQRTARLLCIRFEMLRLAEMERGRLTSVLFLSFLHVGQLSPSLSPFRPNTGK